jgi:hypothetical protein
VTIDSKTMGGFQFKRLGFKIYVGVRHSRSKLAEVRVIDPTGDSRRLDLRLDLARHSPTGFEWGYSGSGPAQLALAILADVFSSSATPKSFNDELAVMLHQEFKRRAIAPLDRERPWRLKEQDIIEHVRRILKFNEEQTP